MKRYESWRSCQGYNNASKIREQLREKLNKEPTKKDFQEAGKYNVWMFLYRFKKKAEAVGKEDTDKAYRDFRSQLHSNKNLRHKILIDLISVMGPDDIIEFIEKIKKRKYS